MLHALPPTISRYSEFLKRKYHRSPVSNDGKFPPTPSKEYIRLAVAKYTPRDINDIMKNTLQGNVEKSLQRRQEIHFEDILKPAKKNGQLPLVLVEGPPGVGKSTLAWELCRRWDEIPSMQQYSLVVLHRFREKDVQDIKDAAGLFPHLDSELQQAVAKEVIDAEGKGVLFILDGFDEFPVSLRQRGLLIDLIRGDILPECTVLVTSRPSATADLLRGCCSVLERRIEILGFTEECVKDYASSVFSSEPEMLKDFLVYISASKSPAINSLMYIPLNAAIVVEVYKNSRRTGCPIPQTLTQLYTQLCITILQRYLEDKHHSCSIDAFTDLPDEYYANFLQLCEVAFKGIVDQKVIFHAESVPRGLIHFGFLDAVTALFGGSRVSYNFLHLTVQEFLAACHISQLSHDGPKVFKEYIEDGRLEVVWRFVAGLTSLEYFNTDILRNKVFCTTENDKLFITNFFLQCLLEAQIQFDYKCINFHDKKISVNTKNTYDNSIDPIDMYAFGYCIASSAPTTSWDVEIFIHFDGFMWGLTSRVPCRGGINKIEINRYAIKMSTVPYLLMNPANILSLITDLSFSSNENLAENQLAQVLPSMKNLNSLVFSNHQDLGEDLLEVLDQLYYSNVTFLSILSVLPETLQSERFATLLTKLIHPLSGKLKSLAIGQREPDSSHLFNTKLLCDIILSSSSLQDLSIHLISLDSLSFLESNTNLTYLHISFEMKPPIGQVVNAIKNNSALDCLNFGIFDIHHQDDIEYVRGLKEVCTESTTLKKIEIVFTGFTDPDDNKACINELRPLFPESFKDRRFICHTVDIIYDVGAYTYIQPISKIENLFDEMYYKLDIHSNSYT